MPPGVLGKGLNLEGVFPQEGTVKEAEGNKNVQL
jgi:hypothetical protein